jgi:hypothetical protein
MQADVDLSILGTYIIDLRPREYSLRGKMYAERE